MFRKAHTRTWKLCNKKSAATDVLYFLLHGHCLCRPSNMFDDLLSIHGPITRYTVSVLTCRMLIRRMTKGYFTIDYLIMAKTRIVLNFFRGITSQPFTTMSPIISSVRRCWFWVRPWRPNYAIKRKYNWCIQNNYGNIFHMVHDRDVIDKN
jgi:hypothetical protein